MSDWTPKVMCAHCGFFYDEEPGIFNFAQNPGDTCRQYGCFGKMIPFDAAQAKALQDAENERIEKRRVECASRPSPWKPGEEPKTFYDFLMWLGSQKK